MAIHLVSRDHTLRRRHRVKTRSASNRTAAPDLISLETERAATFRYGRVSNRTCDLAL